MCLGIPGRIIGLDAEQPKLARVSVGGAERMVNISCILGEDESPQQCIGVWVLVHVGFAMARIDADEAEKTLALLQELAELQDGLAAPGPGELTS